MKRVTFLALRLLPLLLCGAVVVQTAPPRGLNGDEQSSSSSSSSSSSLSFLSEGLRKWVVEKVDVVGETVSRGGNHPVSFQDGGDVGSRRMAHRVFEVRGQAVSEQANLGLHLQNVPPRFKSHDLVNSDVMTSFDLSAPKPLFRKLDALSSLLSETNAVLSKKLKKVKDVVLRRLSSAVPTPHVESAAPKYETRNRNSQGVDVRISPRVDELVRALTHGVAYSRLVSAGGHWMSGRLGGFVDCELCKLGLTLVQTLVGRNASEEEVVSLATGVCKNLHIETDRVCQGLMREFAPEVIFVLRRLVLSPSEICGLVLGPSCGEPYDPWDGWNVTLPSVPQPPPVYPSPPKKGSPTFKFLHLTDVHFDAAYKPGSNAQCGEPLCCRADSGPVTNKSDGAWKFGDYRRCDTPLWTLENLFSTLAAQKDQYAYVIWTGDLPAHDVWEQPREAQLSSLRTVVALLRKYLPDTPIYPSLGNHESSPVNSFPPPYVKGNNSITWLYDALADSWKNWLPASALETVRKGAYYSVSPHKGFRVVSLNMNYCNNQNWWMLLNMTDPAGELQWLVNTLQAAENVGEKVHILGHIPPGIVDCVKAWSWNYYKIVSRYQNTISGQFFGHTHSDSFEVFYDVETFTIPVGVAYVAPSVTPYSDLNMGYRFYTVDGFYANSSYQVLDHSTYILDLEKAEREGNITWELEYSAKAAYNMSSVYPKDWDQLIEVMKRNTTMLQLYNKFYRKSRDSGACDPTCRTARLCEARSGRSHDPNLCRDLEVTDEKSYAEVMMSQPKYC
ncbi:sphingomyelin phosphodiesterase [Aplysia californica]|uniref:Sphingomyelin phosphodiesterase n=1 Tax=Aplysia californica TaxID=6500 RepID=A0ABM0JTP7_APLCA|nr:sphingomyelin phosphodiesterase [Aplysia californica]